MSISSRREERRTWFNQLNIEHHIHKRRGIATLVSNSPDPLTTSFWNVLAEKVHTEMKQPFTERRLPEGICDGWVQISLDKYRKVISVLRKMLMWMMQQEGCHIDHLNHYTLIADSHWLLFFLFSLCILATFMLYFITFFWLKLLYSISLWHSIDDLPIDKWNVFGFQWVAHKTK